MSKKLAILTSGGDCAGLNAVLRAVVIRAHAHGWEVLGIRHGTGGLLTTPLDYLTLTPQDVEGPILRQGGTFLGTTNHGNPFAYPMPDGTKVDRTGEIIAAFRSLGVEGLIGVGGDGSHKILHRIATQGGIPYVAIPKTIDNDVGATENAIGFATAVDVATEALDRLQPTAASHDRVMILEVMGRDAGHIALTAGIAGGADIILLPEIPYTVEGVARKITAVKKSGRNFSLVVVAEAVKKETGEHASIIDSTTGRERYGGIGHYLAEMITQRTGAETRFMVLGHVQRGGQPGAQDRVLATAFGVHAVDLVVEGVFDRMVVWQDRAVVDVPILEAIEHYRCVEPTDALVHTARGMGIYLGEGA